MLPTTGKPVSEIHVFTSAAANYLPKVRVLFESIRKHHPDWKLHLLLVEDLKAEALAQLKVDASVIQLRDLEIPSWRAWAFGHSIVELCTAVKPFMLQRLLRMPNTRGVLYFDPDIALYSCLDDLLAEFDSHSILLTPHQTTPEIGLESVISQEITSLKYGIYNLGFVGVKADRAGLDFADWWAKRLYSFCRDDVPNGLFTDQRWIDLVPAMFDGVRIVRNSRFNVAAWNWTTRQLSESGEDGVSVDGMPLGFYHFTGIDSGNHDLRLAKFPAHYRVLAGLIGRYRESVLSYERLQTSGLGKAVFARQNGVETNGWSFASFDNGRLIEPAWRHCYRDNPELQAQFSDPWRGDAQLLAAFEQQNRNEDSKQGGVGLGFVGTVPVLDQRRLLGLAWSVLRRPRTLTSLLRQLGKIRRDEGWAGVRRRVSRGPGD